MTDTHIEERCEYFCGPYKGFCGKAEYDSDADFFHGDVLGTRDVITFQAETPKKLHRAFRESVDDYLAFCKERGERPEKPFSGKFVTRIDPALHRKISQMAERSGKSLNQFICDCLGTIASGSPAAQATTILSAHANSREKRSKPASKRRSYANR